LREIRRGQRCPADDTRDFVGVGRDRQELGGLLVVAARRLDQYGAVDARIRKVYAQVRDRVVAPDRSESNVGEPLVVGGPHMVVTVNHGHGVGTSGSSRPSATRSRHNAGGISSDAIAIASSTSAGERIPITTDATAG